MSNDTRTRVAGLNKRRKNPATRGSNDMFLKGTTTAVMNGDGITSQRVSSGRKPAKNPAAK